MKIEKLSIEIGSVFPRLGHKCPRPQGSGLAQDQLVRCLVMEVPSPHTHVFKNIIVPLQRTIRAVAGDQNLRVVLYSDKCQDPFSCSFRDMNPAEFRQVLDKMSTP